VLAVGRSSTGRRSAKLRGSPQGSVRPFDTAGADLRGYDACFFCLGVSSAGIERVRISRASTFDLTMGWAQAPARINPAMSFVYTSGAGTGGQGDVGRVKGRTNDACSPCSRLRYMFRLSARAQCKAKSRRNALDAYRLRSPGSAPAAAPGDRAGP